MSSKAGHLATVICLSIIAISVVLVSVKSWGTMYAAPQSDKQTNRHVAISSVVTPTLEPRAYLPVVMRDFCSPISIPTDAKLLGVVFFDYNGDGSQQPNEAGITGASISVGNQSTSSQCNGVYYFRNLPDGSYNLIVTAVSFGYISISKSDLKAIGTPIPVAVNGNTKHDVGLMQGFLTIPYYRQTTFDIGDYFDYDPAYYEYLWWDGRHGNGIWRNHVGIDLNVSTDGILVVAPAPGTVKWNEKDPYSGWCVGAQVLDTVNWEACHITPTVSLNQRVSRGDLIGYVTSFNHVHLDMGLSKTDGHYFRDIYVPLDPSICAEWRWAPNNDPIYVKANCSPGYWTVKNSPQHFD